MHFAGLTDRQAARPRSQVILVPPRAELDCSRLNESLAEKRRGLFFAGESASLAGEWLRLAAEIVGVGGITVRRGVRADPRAYAAASVCLVIPGENFEPGARLTV